MSNRVYILLLALGCFSFFSSAASAQEEKKQRLIWTKNANAHTGLYTTRSYFVAPGVSISAAALYYFGDVDNVGVAFNGGFNVNNLSLSGGITLSYQHPISHHCNIRCGIMGGTLRANNQAKFAAIGRSDFRKFQSIIIQPFAGVQYYPFSAAGFYLYGGLAMTASVISNFDFIHEVNVPGTKDVQQLHLTGSTFGILPMVQLGLGYSWMLSPSWSIGAEAKVDLGLMDTYYANLDAYPLAASQNNLGIQKGTSWQKWRDPSGKWRPHWSDGWFQLGITVTYQWRNCESCHLINNFHNIRRRKH